MESAHHFGSKSLDKCENCGLYRKRSRGSWLYTRYLTGPFTEWVEEIDLCFLVPVERPWREQTIIMMDVETTGLDWTFDDITEIAFTAARLIPSGSRFTVRALGSFHSLLRPRYHLLERAEETAKITGITLDNLADAPPFEDVTEDIVRFFAMHEGALMAAYNAKFDQQFVAGSLLRVGAEVPLPLRSNQALLDPCMLSRKIDRYTKGGNKLTTVVRRYELATEEEIENAHRADHDVDFALRVLARFAGELPERDHLKKTHRLPDGTAELMDWQNTAMGEWAANLFGKWLPGVRKKERLDRFLADQEKVGMLVSEGPLDVDDLEEMIGDEDVAS